MDTRKRKSANKRKTTDEQLLEEDAVDVDDTNSKTKSLKSTVKTRSKTKKSDDSITTTTSTQSDPHTDGEPPPKEPIYGPMPKLSNHRVWSRTILILGVLTVVYFNTNKTTKESSFASHSESYPGRGFETKCSPAYEQNIGSFLDCRPRKCGRLVTDDILLPSEILQLQDLSRRTLEYDTKIKSLFTVYDLTNGKLSYQDTIIDLVQLNSSKSASKGSIFKADDLVLFQIIQAKLKRVIGDHFKLPNYHQSIYLAKPSFFARLTGKGKGSDSYSFVKVDQTNYNSFHYSTVIFLSDFGKDFEGGRFIFPDGDLTNRTVEARKGRVLIYTSGLENKNYIEKVTKGSQIILTIGFTCDLTHSIKRPRL